MTLKYLFIYSVSFMLFMACTHKQQIITVPPAGSFTSYTNLVYGTNDTEQDMDLDLPAVRDMQNTPVVILIHGGAWVQGDKSDFYGLGLDTFFTSVGCALVNMNYRIYWFSYEHVAPPNNLADLQIQDIGLVLAYVKQNAAAWHVNPDRICILGKSSGAHLALLYAYHYNQDGRVKAVIDGFGPTDFMDSSLGNPALDQNVTALLGVTFDSGMQIWHNYSPIFYTATAVPTVIYQGNLDATVPPIQSLMLEDSLLTRGVPDLYFNWVGDGHGWDQTKWLECRDPTWAFVKQYL